MLVLDVPTTETTPPLDALSSGGYLLSPQGVLPLTRVALEARAAAGLARVVVTQHFTNPHDRPLAVTYKLPLPADGAVSGFSFLLNGERILGEVRGRAQAKEDYEQAIVEGKTAALLEQERSSIFTQQLGNIPPGAEIIAEITIDQPLLWLNEGCWEWRFPTVIGPRYSGASGRVLDAAALQVAVVPGSAKEVNAIQTEARLLVHDTLLAPIESTSHRLSHHSREHFAEVAIEKARLDRDLVMRWRAAQPEPETTLRQTTLKRSGHEQCQYGLLTLLPPEHYSPMRSCRRDIIVLLDVSSSMSGRPLEQAKHVTLALIDQLDDHDTLELVAFASRAKRFSRGPAKATAKLKRQATSWVRGLRASGSTEMHDAVLAAIAPLDTNAQRQVILVTDGYIGFEHEIVGTLRTSLPESSRLHCVGVGSAPNRTLTQGASRAGRGAEILIGLDEDAELATARLLARTNAPLVTELTLEGAPLMLCAPAALPDLFAGAPAMISLQLKRQAGALTLRGRTANGPFERQINVSAEAPDDSAEVALRYAREHIEDLETEIAAGGDQPELEGQIERAGLDFQIATRLTSWLAVSATRTVNDAGDRLHEDIPQAMPHGTSISGFGLRERALDGFLNMPMAGLAAAAPRGGAPARIARISRGLPSPAMRSHKANLTGMVFMLALLIAIALFVYWLMGGF